MARIGSAKAMARAVLNALLGLHAAHIVALRASQSNQSIESFLSSLHSFSRWRAKLRVLLSGGLTSWYRGMTERGTYIYPQITGAALGKEQRLLCGFKDWDSPCSQPTWDVSGLPNRKSPKDGLG